MFNLEQLLIPENTLNQLASEARISSTSIEGDKALNLVNAELDLKTYIFERYKFAQINAFDPLGEHVLEIDIK